MRSNDFVDGVRGARHCRSVPNRPSRRIEFAFESTPSSGFLVQKQRESTLQMKRVIEKTLSSETKGG